MVKKEKDDFLAAQGFASANCLIRVLALSEIKWPPFLGGIFYIQNSTTNAKSQENYHLFSFLSDLADSHVLQLCNLNHIGLRGYSPTQFAGPFVLGPRGGHGSALRCHPHCQAGGHPYISVP